MVKQVWLVALTTVLGGCALAPGQRVNDEDLLEKPRTADGGVPDVALLSITPELLVKQAEERHRQAPAMADPLAADATSYEYRIAPHDVLSVIVWDHPELTIPAGEFRTAESAGHAVSPAGTIYYPHVGEVQVAGLTASQVRALLTERLAKQIRTPQLDVKVAAFRAYRVHVTGEVVAPGPVPIADVPLYVLDAIAFVKGPGPEADLRQVTLARDGKRFVLDLESVNERGEMSQNWLLKNGDVLHVPDRSTNKVYVMGEVRRPSSRLMTKGRMTLADAINDSEGFDPLTSNPGGVYVFRGTYAKPFIYKLDATSPDALLLAAQFELHPRDVVYVSTYRLTQWNRVVLQLLPTVQSIWYATDLARRSVELQRVIVP